MLQLFKDGADPNLGNSSSTVFWNLLYKIHNKFEDLQFLPEEVCKNYENHYKHVLTLFINHGADLYGKNSHNETPLEFCLAHEGLSIAVKILFPFYLDTHLNQLRPILERARVSNVKNNLTIYNFNKMFALLEEQELKNQVTANQNCIPLKL